MNRKGKVMNRFALLRKCVEKRSREQQCNGIAIKCEAMARLRAVTFGEGIAKRINETQGRARQHNAKEMQGSEGRWHSLALICAETAQVEKKQEDFNNGY